MAEESNLNITPEMINNLANMLKNNINSQNSEETVNSSANSTTNNNFKNFIKQNNSYKKNTTNSQTSTDDFNSIDFETILKMKSIMENLNNKDDPRANLLYSLKPYLRKSRQKKLDQYVNLLKLSSITRII